MKRRGFLASLAALVCAPFVPKVAPVTPKLWFHPDVFAKLMMPSTPWESRNGDIFETMRVGQTIHVRMPKNWTAKDSLQPHLHTAMADFDLKRVL